MKFLSFQNLVDNKLSLRKTISLEFPFNDIIDESNENPLKKLQKIDGNILILVIGSPASGKSFLTRKLLSEKFTIVNNDTIKSLSKMNKIFEKNLSSKTNMVLDNTNPMALKREYYINKAKSSGFKVIGVFFNLPKKFVMHLNWLRRFSQFSNKISAYVPSIAIHSYFKKLNIPDRSEGFDDLITIDKFYPDFDDPKKEKIFKGIYFN